VGLPDQRGVRRTPFADWLAFDRYLDGVEGGREPSEWLTSVISERFQCPPDVAGRQDPRLCQRIFDLRDFRDVKDVIENAPKDDPRREAVKDSRGARIWNALMHVKQGHLTLEEAADTLTEKAEE
jgi:hypothetical protein